MPPIAPALPTLRGITHYRPRNTMTKRMLAMEWAMSVEEAIEAEAVAQALCMTTEDFSRAFEAFSNKRTPAFQGN